MCLPSLVELAEVFLLYFKLDSRGELCGISMSHNIPIQVSASPLLSVLPVSDCFAVSCDHIKKPGFAPKNLVAKKCASNAVKALENLIITIVFLKEPPNRQNGNSLRSVIDGVVISPAASVRCLVRV